MPAEIRHPKPVPDWETRVFWEGIRRHEILLQRCADCSAIQHRPRAICATCLSSRVEIFEASGRGTVHTYTVTHQNQAPAFRGSVPYVLAYVDLEEGVRVLTNIIGCEPGEVQIGMDVVVDFEDLDEETAVPRFRRA